MLNAQCSFYSIRTNNVTFLHFDPDRSSAGTRSRCTVWHSPLAASSLPAAALTSEDFVSPPNIFCLQTYFHSGVSTSGALRVASWFTPTGALAASLRCWGLRLNLRCRNFLYITGVLEQQRWQGGSKCERRNCLCSGPEKVKVISSQCWL